MKKLLLLFVLFAFAGAYAQDVQSYIELLKSDVKTGKKEIIAEVMQFTEAESEAFWPIYNEYEHELEKLADKRMANIKDFAANFSNMTDAKADELIKNSFNFLEDRQSLNKKYYNKFAEAITPTTAAKYMQVEHAIQLVLDIGVLSNLPLFEKTGTTEQK
jgi:hypothetical protein